MCCLIGQKDWGWLMIFTLSILTDIRVHFNTTRGQGQKSVNREILVPFTVSHGPVFNPSHDFRQRAAFTRGHLQCECKKGPFILNPHWVAAFIAPLQAGPSLFSSISAMWSTTLPSSTPIPPFPRPFAFGPRYSFTSIQHPGHLPPHCCAF